MGENLEKKIENNKQKICLPNYLLEGSNQRAIERFLPINIISKVGSNERYLHGRTPHSIFAWWARRPFTTMRAAVFASLFPVTSEDAAIDISRLTEQLIKSINPSPLIVLHAKELLLESYGRPPRILDIFGGGGTIALEAARLGCEAASLELNPLAYFIQLTILKYSQTSSNLSELVQKYGLYLLHKIEVETDNLYRRDRGDQKERNIAFIWSRSIKCSNPNCRKTISLSKMGWISRKKGRTVFLEQYPDLKKGGFTRKLLFNPIKPLIKEWNTVSGITCPFCHYHYTKREFQSLCTNLQDELLCVCRTNGKCKTYILPEDIDDFFPAENEIQNEIKTELRHIGLPLPETELPLWSGVVNPPLYGIHKHVELFNPRQLLVLLKIIRGLRELYEELCSSISTDVALAVTSVLSSFVDHLVDWNCRLSTWIEENEQVGRALSGPGIPMFWNYVEIDPFSNGPANLYDKLNRIVNAVKTIPKFHVPIDVQMGSATELPFEGEFDAVITDPPYGDNLFYSVLSECIYIWKRMVFKDILPEIFGPEKISAEKEIVAAHYNRNSFKEAMNFYEENLTKALTNAVSLLTPDGVLSLFFSHSTLAAWETIIRVFRKANLMISASWPIIIERKARPRGMRSKATNASFIIVGRRRKGVLHPVDSKLLYNIMEQETIKLADYLIKIGWNKDDIALSCFGKLASFLTIFDIRDGDRVLPLEQCLKNLLCIVKKKFPTFSLQTRTNH
jgi:putative DNA methylase